MNLNVFGTSLYESEVPQTVTVNSTGAFIVQERDGTDVLRVDTDNNRIYITGSLDVSGSTTFGSMTLTGLSGMLKASVGTIVGSCTTSDLPEGSYLYYTDARSRAALSVGSASLTYNSGTGVFDTVQDIRTTATPLFKGLSVSQFAPTFSVLTGGIVKASASGVLGQATIGTGLTYTEPTLATVQDIATNASPTFAGLTIDACVFNTDGSSRLTIKPAADEILLGTNAAADANTHVKTASTYSHIYSYNGGYNPVYIGGTSTSTALQIDTSGVVNINNTTLNLNTNVGSVGSVYADASNFIQSIGDSASYTLQKWNGTDLMAVNSVGNAFHYVDGSGTLGFTGIGGGSVSVSSTGTLFLSGSGGYNKGLIINPDGDVKVYAANNKLVVSNYGAVSCSSSANAMFGMNMYKMFTTEAGEQYRGMYTAVLGYAGIECAWGGLMNFFTSSDATTADASLGTPTPRMTIASNGNITMGGSSQFKWFENSVNPYCLINSSSGVSTGIGSVGSTYGNVGCVSNHPFKILTNNTSRLEIGTNGNTDHYVYQGTIGLYGYGSGHTVVRSVAGILSLESSGSKGIVIDTDGLISTHSSLELGRMGTGDRAAFVDFHSSGAAGANDYSSRILRESGVNGSLSFIHTGTGAVYHQNLHAAAMVFLTNNTERMQIDTNGRMTITQASAGSTYGLRLNQSGAGGSSLFFNGSGSYTVLKDDGGYGTQFQNSSGTALATMLSNGMVNVATQFTYYATAAVNPATTTYYAIRWANDYGTNASSIITVSRNTNEGDSFVAVKSGIYAISINWQSTSSHLIAIARNWTKNTALTATNVNTDTCLAFKWSPAANDIDQMSWTGYLSANDVITLQCNTVAPGQITMTNYEMWKLRFTFIH